jgi:hypothetical protein
MALSEDVLFTGLGDELLNEATGRSSRRWPLVLFVLLFGALVAGYLVRRTRSHGADLPTEVPTPVAA